MQSKWSDKGDSTPALGDIGKFLTGVEDLLRERYENFNAKVVRKRTDIETALRNADTNIHLILVHTGAQPLSARGQKRIDTFLHTLNDAGEIATHESLGQRQVHDAITKGFDGSPINLEVMLRDWGQVREPYQSFYGWVAAADIAEWWGLHKNRLFTQNIRKFMSDSAINLQIQDSLTREPENFWYYNNGITLLCQSVRKKPLGGGDRNHAVLVCDGATVVNGAQTVGTIGRASTSKSTKLSGASVMVRVLSLEGCPEGFATSVTKATNTQNRVQTRDFAALDPEQERIAREMMFNGKRYVFKSGDDQPLPSEGCTIEEATIALACRAQDLRLTVTAKGQLGALWEDINRAPYKALFNSSTTAEDIWESVRVLREVDAALYSEAHRMDASSAQVAVHGNRFVLREVFRLVRKNGLNTERVDLRDLARKVLEHTWNIVRRELPDVYLAWTFKNFGKCRKLEDELNKILFANTPSIERTEQSPPRKDPVGQQGLLFKVTSEEDVSTPARGVVDPNWTFEQAVDAASSWYRPGGISSGPARNAAIEAWAAATGRDRAVLELRKSIARYGSESATARALGMSLPTLRRFMESFAQMRPSTISEKPER